MKTKGNQQRLYLLALFLLVAAIALACTFTLWQRPANQAAGPTIAPEASPSPLNTIPFTTESPQPSPAASPAAQTTLDTIVYYQDNYGYLVPVMCKVPAAEGIAKATLSLMVKNTGNDMQAARLGLRTVLPENVSIDLDIANGVARIDLGKEVMNMQDAAAESNMVTAVVQTLTEFSSVKSVKFLIDGQEQKALKHGTNVSGAFTRGDINLETASVSLSPDNAKPVTLYFPGESGSVLVPVTRLVYSKPDVNTAVLELTKGPSAVSQLSDVLPAGCGLIGVTVENGVAKLNFTKEFVSLALDSDGGRLALKALVLTCTQFEGIDSVEIYVDGEIYDPGENTLSVPTFINVADDVVYDYIQTQSAMILDVD